MGLMIELRCFVFLAIIIGKNCGLECKIGTEISNTKTKGAHTENGARELCSLENRFCGTVTCWTSIMTFTEWNCHPHNNKTQCIEYHTTNLKEKLKKFEIEIVRCNCKFGKMDEEMANDPLFKKSLKCLSGQYDYNGYGSVADAECKKGDEFCYIANCKTDRESHMHWGCAESKNCDAIVAEKAMYSAAGKNFTCQCAFGEEDVDMGNENLSVPLWTPPLRIQFTAVEFNSTAGRRNMLLSVPLRISLVMMTVYLICGIRLVPFLTMDF